TSSMTSLHPTAHMNMVHVSTTAANPIFSRSELAFSDAFRKGESVRLQSSARDVVSECSDDVTIVDEQQDKANESPVLMCSYLNDCLQKAKKALRDRGVTVSSVDGKGRQVDFSSRPIDPIFKEARARFEQERDYVDSGRISASS
ncbi:hypothetical protein PMAYCL1PPCAC_16020, partial [Pristionchus mayeri]